MKKTTKAFLDRIEEDKAVLLIGDREEDTVVLPVKYMPDGIREGTILQMSIEDMPEETKGIRDEVQELINRLNNNR